MGQRRIEYSSLKDQAPFFKEVFRSLNDLFVSSHILGWNPIRPANSTADLFLKKQEVMGKMLGRVFVEDIRGGVVAEFKIDFFLAGILQAVQIGIQDSIAKPVRARKVVLSPHGGG